MKRLLGCVVLLFGVSRSALAANPAKNRPFNWGLQGNYVFQLSNVHQRSWGQDFPCTYTDQNNVAHTVTVHAGGSLTFTTVDFGAANFNDLLGTFTATFTEERQFDQAASDATVSVQFDASCNTTNVNNGSAAFAAPSLTKTGSFNISPSGVGSIVLVDGSSLVFVVGGGAFAECINGAVVTDYPNTILMHGVTDKEGPVGTAIRNDINPILCH